MEDRGEVLYLDVGLFLSLKGRSIVGHLGFQHDKSVLPGFSLNAVHILREFRKRVLGERSALNHNHQRRMSAVSEIVIVEALRSAAAVYAEYLTAPTDFAIRCRADSKLQNLVCLIIEVDSVALSGVFAVPLIHNAGVAEFLEIHHLSGDVLTVLSEFALSGLFCALVEE